MIINALARSIQRIKSITFASVVIYEIHSNGQIYAVIYTMFYRDLCSFHLYALLALRLVDLVSRDALGRFGLLLASHHQTG
jgi:hypothetical protein